MTLQNERFEELLSRHLAAELEPQRGRAAAAFRAQMAAEAAEREARQIAGGSRKRESWARREVSKPAVWLWTGVPSLIAAGLAVVLTLHLVNRPSEVGPDQMIVTRGNVSGFVEPSDGSVPVSGVGGGGALAGYNDVTPKREEPPLPLPPVRPTNPYPMPGR